MIDFNLNLIEANGNLVVRASADGLGEAFCFLSGEDREGLDRVRLHIESVMETRVSDGEFAQLGRRLFDLLFQGDVRDLYQRVCALSEDSLRGPLMILLKMGPQSNLHEIPWEILHDGQRPLAQDARTTVARYLEQPTPIDSLQVEPPLRVLLTTANPADMPPLAVEKEIGLVRLAYEGAGPLVNLKVEESVSLDRLEEIWRRAGTQGQPFHIWHHCGHGGRVQVPGGTEFRLFLEKNRRSEPIEVERLQDLVSFCPQLRVAILNVCRAGSSAGIVPALSRLRVPVVIGFKHAVNDSAALRFACALHDALLHTPVEWAVNAARKSMKINHPETLDWNHAVVVSRRKDRGGLLKPIRKEGKSSPKGSASKGGKPAVNVDMKFGKVKAQDFEAIGVNVVGNAPGDPGQDTKVRMSVEEIDAIRVKQIGYQALEGFSPKEIEKREERLVELVEKMDRYLSERA